MALSNWDTLAFDENGKSSIGYFENKTKDAIEIYKNWDIVKILAQRRDVNPFPDDKREI